MKPLKEVLGHVELSLRSRQDIGQIMSQDVLERIPPELVVMQETGEGTWERAARQAPGTGQLPEDRPTAVHVDMEFEEVLGEPVIDGLAENLAGLGPLRFHCLRTEPIG